MKRKLIIIALFILLITTGCNVDYNVTIDSKFQVYEKVKFIGENDIILNNVEDIDLYLDEQINTYKLINQFKAYNYKKKKGSINSYVEMSRKYPSLDVYSNSPILGQFFNNVQITRENDTIKVASIGKNLYDQYFAENNIHEPEFFMDSIKIKIRLHNEILDHNADYYDYVKNTLEWEITKDKNLSEFYFILGPNKKYGIILIDAIYMNKLSLGIITTTILGLYLFSKKVYNSHIINNSI